LKTAENVAAWTPERVATLKQLWSEGLSASQISKRMHGTTRNSVIAKVHRLRNRGEDLSVRAAPSAPTVGRVKPKPVAAPKQPMPKGVMVLAPQTGGDKATANRVENIEARARPPENVIMMAREFRPLAGCEPVPFGSKGCKWPVSPEGADMLCCGAPRDGDRSYCIAHAEVAYQKPKPGAPKNGNQLIRSLRRWAA
jgi:GcrA cell cycle regulator